MSSRNRAVGSAFFALLLAGCNTAPPALPPDTTSLNRVRNATLADFPLEDQAMSCDDIAKQRGDIAAAMQADSSAIDANRTRNQIAGYFGALFILPAIAMVPNNTERDDVAKLYGRRDTLIKLSALKNCAVASNDAK